MRKLSQITTAIALLAIVSGCSAKSESSIAPSPVASPVPVASASPNPFGLPKPSCGDPAVGGDEKWFGVFIDGGDVQEVRKKYCGDAIAMTREVTGKPSIQVASFNDRARAVAFAAAVGGEASDYDQKSVNETASSSTESPVPIPTAVESPKEVVRFKITKEGYFAATSKEMLDKAGRYSVDGDNEALQTLFDSGEVFKLKGGVKVFIDQCEGLLCYTVAIRPQGSTQVVWVHSEALEN